MLQARVLRRLLLAGGVGHLSAASGLVRIGSRLYVVADDEHGLGLFDLDTDAPGRLVELLAGVLPDEHAARRAAKPDLEALTALPAFAGFPHGALLAIGSGSRAQRKRGVLVALDADGALAGPIRPVDLTPLLAPLAVHFPALNIEGAFVSGESLCLLQRGNTQSPLNACIGFGWHEVRRWLEAGGAAPAAASITRYDLGLLDGVPLSFTDGAVLPGGGWVFSAAAEDTSDNYADGRCLGSAVGVVGADGKLRPLERLDLVCKVEGIAVAAERDLLQLLMVTDADDRDAAALLLAVTWTPGDTQR